MNILKSRKNFQLKILSNQFDFIIINQRDIDTRTRVEIMLILIQKKNEINIFRLNQVSKREIERNSNFRFILINIFIILMEEYIGYHYVGIFFLLNII